MSQILERSTTLPQVRVRPRNLRRMRQDLYQIEIELKGVSSSIKLSWSDLGFEGEELEELEASEARLSAIPLFAAVNELGAELRKGRDTIHRLMLKADEGKRACTEDKLAIVWEQFEALKETSRTLREQLKERYWAGQADFVNRIDQMLNLEAFGLKDRFGWGDEDILEKAESLTDKFPSSENLDDYLQVRIGSYELLPSLESQIRAEATLQNAEAERLESQTRQQSAEAASRFQRQKEEDTIRLRNELYQSARNAGMEIVSEMIERLSKWEVGSKSENFKKRIKGFISTLEAYLGADLDGSLNEIFDQLQVVRKIVNQGDHVKADALSLDSREKLQTQIEQIKAELEDRLEILTSEGDGHTTASAFGLLLN